MDGYRSIPSFYRFEQKGALPDLPEPPVEATLKPYAPSIRDRLASWMMGDGRASEGRRRFIEGLIGSTGLGTTGLSIADATPAGTLFDMDEAVREGDYQGAAMSIMPLKAKKAGALMKHAYAGGGIVRRAEGALGKVIKGADRPGLISTRLPTGKGALEDPLENYLSIDTNAMRASPDAFDHNVDLIRRYPVIPEEVARDGSAEDVLKAYNDVSRSNLLFLHDKMPESMRARAQLWYDGANRLARQRAERYGMPIESVSGVYAALSPQKDWFQNVSLGDRVLDIYHTAQQAQFNEAMERTARRLFPKDEHTLVIDSLRGRRLSDLQSPEAKALWLRTFDQTYNSPEYRIVSPEGDFGEIAVSKGGDPRRAAWGSLNEIGKAVSAIESGGDVDLLSRLMGERHKVRNFYNNILAPDSRLGQITADTHAVAAQQLRPLSGNSVEVAHNFKNNLAKDKRPDDWVGAKGSSITGAQGTYGINADGYRDAADGVGRLPRQMQSITWEGVRGLFSPRFKSDPKNLAAVDDIWRQAREGRISVEEAQQRIYDYAGGIKAPDWTDMEVD